MFDLFNPRPKSVPAESAAEGMGSVGGHRSFRPSALGTLGLVLAIVLWGYNYKLSLYHPHRDTVSRILVARLWVDQRNADTPVDTQQHATPNAIAPSPLQVFPLVCVCILLVVPTRVRSTHSRKSLLPLRSPPAAAVLA